MKPTYCNPLPIEKLVSGRWLDCSPQEDPRSYHDYRSIADPSVIYDEGRWILYPSYSLAYVSEDFVHWKHVDIGVPHVRYSPAVVKFRGKWYLCGHNIETLYVADSPIGPFSPCGVFTDTAGNVVKVVDQCFLADGDHLYLYWQHVRTPKSSEDMEFCACILGVELDPEAPWQFLGEPVPVYQFEPSVSWQRFGEHNENERLGWVEGPWMMKRGDLIYMLYAACGTQFSTYANGVAISREGPLATFHRQVRHDPFTRKTDGLVRGPGHGSLVEGPDGTLWTFYSLIFNFNHKFERRIGMDPVGVDEDGELYCTVTDTPQFAPGVLAHPEAGNSAGLLPLGARQPATASSHAPGREPLYAVDESVLTWWQPAADDPLPTLTLRLGANPGYLISAIRLLWRDVGMETLDGIDPGPFRYRIEYRDGDAWKVLVDARDNTDDLCVDYRTFEPILTNEIRLTIVGAPEGITPGLCGITPFGTCYHPAK